MTRHGVHDATTDSRIISTWLARWPFANLGIATGMPSGLVVLDVDVVGGRQGDRALLELVETHGALQPLAHALTGSGGEHYYFQHPGGRVPCSASRLGHGLDIRGDGGFVVAPPSLHVTGERYAWIETDWLGDPLSEVLR